MDTTSGSDHVSVTSYQTSVTILSETTEEPTTTLRYPWTTESSSTVVPTSIATSSLPVSETSETAGKATTAASSGVNPAAIVVPIIVVMFIIVVVVLVIFLIRRRRRLLEAHRIPPPPMPRLEEVDRTRTSAVGGPGCEIWMDSIPYQTNENGLNDYTDPPEVHHIDHADHQREESTYVLREDLNQASAVTSTSGVLSSGISTLGRTLKPAKTENVYQNSGFTGRVEDDAFYVNATRRSEIESVISDDDDDGGEIVGTHLPRRTTSGDGVNAIVDMTPENPSGLRKNVCSIFPSSAGHIGNSKAS